MTRVVTQTLLQRAADPDGFVANGTFSAGLLTLDGALVTNRPGDGVAEVNFEGDGFLGVLVGFTTGLTGSTAVATIKGRDIDGRVVTEDVTLPGASSAVSSQLAYKYIESIEIDDAATNLSVGIIATDDQYGSWIIWDWYQHDALATLQVEEVAGTLDATVEHTLQGDLFQNGWDPNVPLITEAAPFDAITATVSGNITGPFVATRLKVNGASAGAQARFRFLQAAR